MTAQLPDLLLHNGSNCALLCNPLTAYFDKCPNQHRLAATSTMNWRGYVASWKITNDRLYLSDVDGQICTREHDVDQKPSSWGPVGHKGACHKRRVGIDYLFDTSTGNVFADWFSGELRVATGEMIEYQHSGYASKYDRYLIINVESGKVKNTKQIGGADYEKHQWAERQKTLPQTKPWWAFWLPFPKTRG